MKISGNIQKLIHNELVEKAESVLASAAQDVQKHLGMTPETHLEEGGRYDVITDFIDKNLEVKKLILGGGIDAKSPGPLVSYFTHKGLDKLRVPLVIVPENINLDD